MEQPGRPAITPRPENQNPPQDHSHRPAHFSGGSRLSLPGTGDGTFAPPIVSTVNPHPGVVPTLPVAAALADLNGDANLDLAVSGGTDRTLHIMLGDGTGRFTTTEGYPVQIGRTIIADDFNHDGRPDLAVTELLGQTEVLLHN